jgi:hypothetical protein
MQYHLSPSGALRSIGVRRDRRPRGVAERQPARLQGNAQLSPRLDQLSRWFPPVDHLDRALFVIAFNVLGCIADPRFALPVAPAPVFFGGCALAGRG